MALYQFRRLLTLGDKGFEGQFSHGGTEPLYAMPADGSKPAGLADLRVDTEVLNTEHAAIPGKWYFSLKDHALLGCELTVLRDDDPCELYFSGYKKVHNRSLPFRIEVRYGNGVFGIFTLNHYELAANQ
jgi:hypothetical protein